MAEKENALKNWQAYNLVDSKEDMMALLNILEAHDKKIDSLHGVPLHAYEEFCGIVGTFVSIRDIVKSLFDFHVFYKSEEEFLKQMKQDSEEEDESLEEHLKYESYTKTSDGIVRFLYY